MKPLLALAALLLACDARDAPPPAPEPTTPPPQVTPCQDGRCLTPGAARGFAHGAPLARAPRALPFIVFTPTPHVAPHLGARATLPLGWRSAPSATSWRWFPPNTPQTTFPLTAQPREDGARLLVERRDDIITSWRERGFRVVEARASESPARLTLLLEREGDPVDGVAFVADKERTLVVTAERSAGLPNATRLAALEAAEPIPATLRVLPGALQSLRAPIALELLPGWVPEPFHPSGHTLAAAGEPFRDSPLRQRFIVEHHPTSGTAPDLEDIARSILDEARRDPIPSELLVSEPGRFRLHPAHRIELRFAAPPLTRDLVPWVSADIPVAPQAVRVMITLFTLEDGSWLSARGVFPEGPHARLYRRWLQRLELR